jgi:transposase
MRKSIDGLGFFINSELGFDPRCGNIFLFCGKNCSKLKALLYERDGFLLLYKRLDSGRFRWPRSETQARQLTGQQLRWLLEGLEIEQPHAIRESCGGDLF